MTSPKPGRGDHLSAAERAELLALAARPELTPGQVAKILRARTGRGVDVSGVRRLRARILAGTARPDPTHLSAEERAILAALVAQAGPGFNAAEVARAFAVASGRSVHASRVRRAAAAAGVPRGGVGKFGRAPSWDSAITRPRGPRGIVRPDAGGGSPQDCPGR